MVGKGARRQRKSLAGVLQPFVPLRISWSGRGELPVLTGAEIAGVSVNLAGPSLFCGFYLNELLLNLLPWQDSSPGIHDIYLLTLGHIGDEGLRESALRFFELALLDEIGYGLSLEYDSQGGRVMPERSYRYEIEVGACEVKDEFQSDLIKGSTLLGLSRRYLGNAEELRQAKHLLRKVINYRLQGRTLKSREMFKNFCG